MRVGWYPVFLREMLLFKRRFFRLGYLLSAMMVPVIYLVVFGLGLGRNIQVSSSSYLGFLIPGLVAMTSMNNSFTWIANSVNLGRVYFKTFQVLVQAPISFLDVVLGEVMAATAKGLFAGFLLLVAGLLTAEDLRLGLPFFVAFFLNSLLFSAMGFVVGMLTKGHEETATYSNFLILPMAFFCGTFFPLERIPSFILPIVYIMPLTHTNILIRKSSFDLPGVISLLVLVTYTASLMLLGARLMRNYSE